LPCAPHSTGWNHTLSQVHRLYREAVNGPYGLDFLDYIVRDSFYCGFSTRPTVDFLIDHMVLLREPESGAVKLAFTQHVMHELVSFAQQRLDLEKKVYSNKTQRAITAMLALAVLGASQAARVNVHELHRYSDDGLLDDLQDCDEARRIIELIRSRDLYEVVYRFDAKSLEVNPAVGRALRLWGPAQVNALKQTIYSELNDLNEGDLLLSFPHPEERTCKEGEVTVVNLEDHTVKRLNEIDPWIQEYEREYAKLRKYLVLLSPKAYKEKGEKVAEKIEKNFAEWVLQVQGIKQLRDESAQGKLTALTEIQWSVLKLLLDRRCTAEELGPKLEGRTRSTIAYHLGRLDQLGLVAKERRGKKVAYSVSPEYETIVRDGLRSQERSEG
jgi:HD superfamily phosphohydrolase/DNA-binding transcriptional ArsR family regulator